MGRNNSVIENLTTLTLYCCITTVPYLFTTIRVPMIFPKKQTKQNNEITTTTTILFHIVQIQNKYKLS